MVFETLCQFDDAGAYGFEFWLNEPRCLDEPGGESQGEGREGSDVDVPRTFCSQGGSSEG